jgi:hypothetical protein
MFLPSTSAALPVLSHGRRHESESESNKIIINCCVERIWWPAEREKRIFILRLGNINV